MNDLLEWFRVWQQADAVTMYCGTLHRWSDERARSLYMRAMIPAFEGSAK